MSDQEDFDDQEEMDVDLSQGDADDNVSDELNDIDDSDDSDIDEEVKLYEKFAEILGQISADPYAYEYYVELVKVAQ